MTSGGNNFDYFPENQLTKFSASTNLGGEPAPGAPPAYATGCGWTVGLRGYDWASAMKTRHELIVQHASQIPRERERERERERLREGEGSNRL